METPATEEYPAILWNEDELLERDPCERERTCVMKGTDANGKEYTAIGVIVCDQLELISDIELLTT